MTLGLLGCLVILVLGVVGIVGPCRAGFRLGLGLWDFRVSQFRAFGFSV